MNFYQLIGLSVFIFCTSFSTVDSIKSIPSEFKIDWQAEIDGDFSFKEKWEYPENVYLNSFGQLSCDGICPERTYQMKDSKGKILKDSLAAFYTLVDTSHQFYTLESENRMYEYSGINQIHFQRKGNVIEGVTITNASTHSRLHIKIKDDFFTAWVNFNSIRRIPSYNFPITNGNLTIDKTLWKQGIIKATFDFDFENTYEPDEQLFWKGKIYATIQEEND